MNDFTKEELKYFIAVMKPFHWLYQEDPLALEAKLQAMIDGYCEHEWRNNCCGCSPSNICCTKCDRCLSDEELYESSK